VELRDRVDRLEGVPEDLGADDEDGACVSALLNLGYPRATAEKAVHRAHEVLGESATLEGLIREALRAVTR
jgi:Holliday junction resolvasome RuvABC DNA-binding subunit